MGVENNIPPQVPRGLSEVVAYFGDPGFRILIDKTWAVDPAWEAASMTMVEHALLPHGRIYAHRRVAAPMRRLLDRWMLRRQLGDAYYIRSFGCYAPRAQRGSTGIIPSMHGFGIAFDLNSDSNPMIYPCYTGEPKRYDPGAKDIPDAWIYDARAEGWFWGGDFNSRFDPMHFQFATGC